MLAKFKKQWQYHLMLLPGVLLVLIFSYIPLYGVIIAFQNYNPGMGFSSPWVGLKIFNICLVSLHFKNDLEYILYCIF